MKLGKTKREPRSRAEAYHSIARSLLETARGLDVIGETRYGNGWPSCRCTQRSPTPTR
jgi:hypothetical protein